MPVDRHRRDAIASDLIKYLRYEISTAIFWTNTTAILNSAPLKSRISKQDGGPGFPVHVPSEIVHAPIDDHVLDNYISHVLRLHFCGLTLSKKTSTKEQSYNVLVRTVALLRSDLSETELTYPPPLRQLIPFARTTIVLIAFMLLATLTILSIRLHPTFLLLWPFFGSILLRKWKLFTKPPIPEDAGIYPFQTVEQVKLVICILNSNEIPAFDPKRYTLPPKQKKKKTFKFYLLLIIIIPIGLLSALLSLMGLLIAMILVVALWPVTLFTTLRKSAS